MCGRFTLKTNPSEWGQLLLPELDMGSLASVTADWQPRYNIAPTQSILGLLSRPVSDQKPGLAPSGLEAATLIARAFRWGLVPFWSDDLAIGNRMINARSETLLEKPAFRTAIAKHRCIIPTDGYYEWKAEGKQKRPFWIHRSDQKAFGFAGLWDRNRKATDQEVYSATIITAPATEALAALHNRMPAILAGEALRAWLDPKTSASDAQEILNSQRETELEAIEVSTHVNNPKHEDAQCLWSAKAQP